MPTHGPRAPRFTLKQLQYIVAVSQEGGVTQAARLLNVAPSSISEAIAQLEQGFGFSLFVRRHAQGVATTPDGVKLIASARRLLEDASELEDQAASISMSAGGTLQLGCFKTIAPIVLPRLMRSFADAHPQVKIGMAVGDQVAAKLGVKLVLVNANGPDRIPYLATDRIDISLGGLTRSADRAKVIDFTVPITGNNYGVITREDTKVESFADLNRESATIAMSRGTVVLAAVQAMLPKAKFILLDNIPDRDRTLAQGRADAIVDLIDNPAMVKTFPNVKWKIFPITELPPSFDCVGVAKGNTNLRTWLNIAIWELHTSGFVTATWLKWFGRPMALQVPASPFF